MRDSAVHHAEQLTEAHCVLRATGSQTGRSRWLSPKTSPVRHLHYGRIRMDPHDSAIRFHSGQHETSLICLKGRAEVETAGQRFTMTPYDALYVPRESDIEVRGGGACDLAEISAPVEGNYPLRFVPFLEVRRDPGLSFVTGGETTSRHLNILIGKNVEAGRLVAGVTFSSPGNWTSWPPHEHAALLEEAYLYIDMPAPAWGVQFVYTDAQAPELMTVVREDDCVIMPKGYHPNVAAPGSSINFLWMMAAHREVVDRQFGVVNVQPEYAGGQTGLETGRASGGK